MHDGGRKIMNHKMYVPRWAAIAMAACVLVIGGVLGFLVPAWAGVGAPSSNAAPVYVARDAGAAAPNPAGFANVVGPDLGAVVNISSSRVVRTQNVPLSPFLNDPFFRQFFGNLLPQAPSQPQAQREEALGSGVIVSSGGYILTNNHVIEKATDIKVFLRDKREFRAKVVGTDPKTDLAVLKIDAKGLPTLTFGDSSKLRVGDYALAIGDPFGVGETVTMGIVSATGRGNLDIEDYEDFIQTDASINPGNSGGALIDSRGELIGINTAILAGNGGGNQGIGFAIPINMAHYVLNQIIEHGKVVRGWLGVAIQEVTPSLAKAFNVPPEKGALIGDVMPNSPAAQAGLKRGDIITSLQGQPVNSPNELRLQIAQMTPGTELHLGVLENGKSREVSVKLAEMPEKTTRASAQQSQGPTGPMQGVQVQSLTPDIAQQLNVPENTKGVVVTEVPADSPASAVGLRRGDIIEEVNRKPVSSTSQYEAAVRQVGNQPVVLLVNRRGTTAFIVVQPQ
jgi:serine protease Do